MNNLFKTKLQVNRKILNLIYKTILNNILISRVKSMEILKREIVLNIIYSKN